MNSASSYSEPHTSHAIPAVVVDFPLCTVHFALSFPARSSFAGSFFAGSFFKKRLETWGAGVSILLTGRDLGPLWVRNARPKEAKAG